MSRSLLIGLVVLGAGVLAWASVGPAQDPALPASLREAVPSLPTTISAPEAAIGEAVAPWPEAAAETVLQLDAIAGQDGHRAVVGGSLCEGERTTHSALFLTEDGGESWRAIGPALSGTRILAVSLIGSSIWAVGQALDDDGERIADLPPMLLRSEDGGAHWQQGPLLVDGHRGGPLRSCELLRMDQRSALLLASRLDRPGEYAELCSADRGESWRWLRSRPGDHADLQRANRQQSSGDWAWRLVDGIVQRRDPLGGVWSDTAAQPVDRYGFPTTQAYFAVLLEAPELETSSLEQRLDESRATALGG